MRFICVINSKLYPKLTEVDCLKDNVATKQSTIVNRVTKHLRQAILDGTLRANERLIQEEWAERLNVSRMPVREALTQLEMEGLVEIIPHKGAIATPITPDDIEEIYYTRALLEGLAVEKSLPYLTENDHRKLEKILVRMEELELSDETNDEYIQLNLSFHQTLRSGCPWPRVLKMVENLGISPIAPSLLIDYYQETQREHRLIYESVLRGDPKELKAIVEYHIFRTKNNLIQHMDRLQTTRSTSVE